MPATPELSPLKDAGIAEARVLDAQFQAQPATASASEQCGRRKRAAEQSPADKPKPRKPKPIATFMPTALTKQQEDQLAELEKLYHCAVDRYIFRKTDKVDPHVLKIIEASAAAMEGSQRSRRKASTVAMLDSWTQDASAADMADAPHDDDPRRDHRELLQQRLLRRRNAKPLVAFKDERTVAKFKARFANLLSCKCHGGLLAEGNPLRDPVEVFKAAMDLHMKKALSLWNNGRTGQHYMQQFLIDEIRKAVEVKSAANFSGPLRTAATGPRIVSVPAPLTGEPIRRMTAPSPPTKIAMKVHKWKSEWVCIDCFLNIYDIPRSSYFKQQRDVLLGVCTAVRKTPDNFDERKANSETGKMMAAMLHHASKGDPMPNRKKIALVERSLREVFESLQRTMKTGWDAGASAVKKAIAFSTFCKALRSSGLKKLISTAKSTPFSKCDVCESLREAARRHAKDSMDMQELERFKEEHHREHEAERALSHKRRDKARRNPDDYWFIMVDGMTQNTTQLPKVVQRTKLNDAHPSGQLQVQVTGVLGWGTPIAVALYNSLPHLYGGANHLIAIVNHFLRANDDRLKDRDWATKAVQRDAHHPFDFYDVGPSLMRGWNVDVSKPGAEPPQDEAKGDAAEDDAPPARTKSEEQRENKTLENALKLCKTFRGQTNAQRRAPVLYIQMDNTSKDNKTKAMFAYLGLLVARGVFRKIKMNFLIKGHTHDTIDQLFSVVSNYLSKFDVWAPSLLAKLMAFAYRSFSNVAASIYWVRHVPAIDAIIKGHFRGSKHDAFIKHFRPFHNFRITKEMVKRVENGVEVEKECVVLHARQYARQFDSDPHFRPVDSKGKYNKSWVMFEMDNLPDLDVAARLPSIDCAAAIDATMAHVKAIADQRLSDKFGSRLPAQYYEEWKELVAAYNAERGSPAARDLLTSACTDCEKWRAKRTKYAKRLPKQNDESQDAKVLRNECKSKMASLDASVAECIRSNPDKHPRLAGWWSQEWTAFEPASERPRAARAPPSAAPPQHSAAMAVSALPPPRASSSAGMRELQQQYARSSAYTDGVMQRRIRAINDDGAMLSGLGERHADLQHAPAADTVIERGHFVFVLAPIWAGKEGEVWKTNTPFYLYQRPPAGGLQRDGVPDEAKQEPDVLRMDDSGFKTMYSEQWKPQRRIRQNDKRPREQRDWGDDGFDARAQYEEYKRDPLGYLKRAGFRQRKAEKLKRKIDGDCDGSFSSFWMHFECANYEWSHAPMELEVARRTYSEGTVRGHLFQHKSTFILVEADPLDHRPRAKGRGSYKLKGTVVSKLIHLLNDMDNELHREYFRLAQHTWQESAPAAASASSASSSSSA